VLGAHPALHDRHYRADIDGLRAVAVLPVLLYHAGVGPFSGGFVGVDVFFVVSGFLISRILLTDIDLQRFSILRFYDRRIRRIIPAFAAMALGTSLAATFILTPLELERFGKSLIAAAAFSSNLWFWQGTDYFAAPSHTEILLHTWSLAVEEQFYLLWPLLLWAFSERRRSLYLAACIAGVLVSLVVSHYAAFKSPAAAFYLLPSRAWELGLGAVLASPAMPRSRHGASREVTAAVGLLLILLAVFTYDAETPFPGLYAAVPSLGAALLIHSGAGTRVGELLSAKPMVAVGLISYSLYLWHWPALCLSRQYAGRELTALETAAALAACAALAVASWRYVELPFRKASSERTRSSAWLAVRGAAVVTVVSSSVGVLFWKTHGLPVRGPQAAVLAERAIRESHDSAAYCVIHDATQPDITACRSGTKPPVVALWGDSHAGHLAGALAAHAREANASVLFLVLGGCPPGIGARVSGPVADTRCDELNAYALSRIRHYNTISSVILVSRWSRYTETLPSKGEEGLPIYLTDDASSERSPGNSRRVLSDSVGRTVSELQQLGLRVALVGQVPEFGIDTARCVVHARWTSRPETRCFADSASVRARLSASTVILRELASAHPGLRIVDPLPLFCDERLCRSVLRNELLYSDDDHLSLAGAEYVLQHVDVVDHWRGAMASQPNAYGK